MFLIIKKKKIEEESSNSVSVLNSSYKFWNTLKFNSKKDKEINVSLLDDKKIIPNNATTKESEFNHT